MFDIIITSTEKKVNMAKRRDQMKAEESSLWEKRTMF